MGVLGLSSFFENFYGSCSQRFSDIRKQAFVDHMYVDMNSVLHDAIRTHGLNLLEESRTAQLEFSKNIVFHVVKHMKDIIEVVTPSKSVVLAFDGPVNVAKLQQQQQRRVRQCVGSQCITPGFWIMPLIENEIVASVAKIILQVTNTFSRRSRDKIDTIVVLDGMRSPGEGEIKIAKHIHRNIARDHATGTHIIVGADSDLYLIGFGVLPSLNISFLNTLSMKIFCLSSIWASFLTKCFDDSPQKAIKKVLGKPKTVANSWEHVDSVQRLNCTRLDFILLSLFCGNDYLSSVDGFDGRNMWIVYQKYLKNRIYLIENDSNSIDSIFLKLMRKESNSKNAGLLIKLKLQNIHAFLKFALKSSSTGEKANQIKKKQTNATLIPHWQNTQSSVRDYLEGVSWCLSTIIQGECPNIYYIPSRYVPTVHEIIAYSASVESDLNLSYAHAPKELRKHFSPIVHFHLAVQSSLLFDKKLRFTDSKEINEPLPARYGTDTASFPINGQKFTGTVLTYVEKAHKYLQALRQRWGAVTNKWKVTDRCQFHLFHSPNSYEALMALQFFFDHVKAWKVKKLVNSHASLPDPDDDYFLTQRLPRIKLDRESSHIEIRSFLTQSVLTRLVTSPETLDKTRSVFCKNLLPIFKKHEKKSRKRPIIEMDVTV